MNYRSAYRYIFGLATALLTSLPSVFAQGSGTPQFRNTTANGAEVGYPLYGGGTNRVQCIYGPNLFNSNGTSGTPAGSGRIKNIYFHVGSLLMTAPVFSDFTIRLSQNTGTRDTFSGTSWNTPMTEVFYSSTFTITGTQSTWIKIPLQAGFKYNPNLSLVFEMTVSSGVACTVKAGVTGTKKNRIFGTYSGSSGTALGTGLLNLGFDIEPMVPNNAGVLGLVSPRTFCAGTHAVKVNIVNNGGKPLDSVRIYYSVNGSLQPPIFYTTRIDTQGNSNGNVKTITLLTDTFKTGVLKNFKIWTSHPNGMQDTFNTDDTLYTRLKPALNGNYRIGGSGSQYATLTAAAADLNEFGICGPVKFTVDTGTYKERLILDRVRGTSSVNTITFRGVDRTKTIIFNKATSELNWQTVLLNGVNYVRFSNFTVKAMDSVLAVGIHLVASSNNVIDSCDIEMRKNSWSFRLTGVAGTGSMTSMIPGHSGDTNVISNLNIIGGYYGINYSGSASWQHNYGNTFRNNVMRDYLRNGIYLMALTNTLIEGNDMASQRMVDVNGMTLSALNRYTCVKNKIFSTREGLFLEFSNYYYYPPKDTSRSLVANNVIITSGPGGPVAALQIFYGRRIDFHHNSVLGWSATQLWSMKDVDSSSFRNNIFKDTVNGTKIAIGASNFSSRFSIDHNVYYFPSSIARISFAGTLYSDVNNWITSVTSMNQNSQVQAPAFTSNTNLKLFPGNRPRGSYAGVDDDCDGVLRCRKNPTIGAFELVSGTLPDKKNPVFACTGDTQKYIMSPPGNLLNSDYGSKWLVKSITLKTANGNAPKNSFIVYPSNAGPGYVGFVPDQSEADSAFNLQFITEDMTGLGCYSTFGKYILVNARPMASFTISPPQVCFGDSVKLLNASTGPAGTTYSWNMGNNGTIIKKPAFSFLYPVSGIFTVTLMAVTPGCTDTSRLVTVVGNSQGSRFVKALPYNGSIKFGTKKDPDIACAADTLTYEVMPPTGFTNAHFKTYWDVSDVKVSGLKGILTDTFITPADSAHGFKISLIPSLTFDGDTFLLRLKIRSLVAGKCDSSISRYVVIGHTPEVDFTHSPGCLGAGPVVFTDLTTIPSGALSYTWNFGDGGTSVSRNSSHYYADTGKYLVTHTAVSDKGCENKTSMPVQVYMLPKVKFGFTGECTGKPVAFTDSTLIYGDKPGSRTWKYGDGGTDSVQNAAHIYNNPGTYYPVLVVTALSGCRDSSIKSVTIHKTPDAGFTTADVCNGVPATFSSNPANASGTLYKWTFGDGDSSDIANPSHLYAVSPTVAQTFAVGLKVVKPGTGCSHAYSATVTVLPKPVITYKIIHISKQEKRFVPSDSIGLGFKWHFGDGDSSSNISPVHTYPAGNANYVLRLTVINQPGCSWSSTDTVRINTIDVEDINSMQHMTLFPNPADKMITISCDSPGDFGIYTISGARVSEGQLRPGDNHVDVSTLPAGVYLVKTSVKTFNLLKADR